MKLARLLLVGLLGIFCVCGCAGCLKVSLDCDVDVTWDVEKVVTDRGTDPVTG